VLTELERSQLVTVSEDQLVLRHPLVRSALYSAAPLAERRRVHAALAAVLTGEQDADRRAWHRSAAVVEPDETVVDDLVDAALRSQARGGYEAAAAAWARAAELSTRSAARAEMYLHAGRAAWVAGRPAQARDLTGQARDEAEEPLLRADARRLRARIEWNTGSVSLAHKMLLSAARDVAPHDQQRARELAAEAMAIAAWDGSSGVGLDPSVFVATASDDAPARDRCYSALLHGLRHVVSREWRRAGPPLRRAFKIHEEMPGDFELIPNLSVAALHIGDYEAARDYHERLLTEARHTGVMVMVLYALTRLVFSDLAEGRWASAVGHASEAVRLGQETGHPVLAAAPQAWLLLLAGLRGEDDFGRLAAELKDASSSQGAGILDVLLRDVEHWAHGIRTLNRPSFALHHLTQMSHPVTQRMAGLDRIETAVRDDQPKLAMSWVQDLEDFAEGTEQLWPAAMSEHGRALLATGAQVENHFLRALELHERLDRPFERARTQLAYGEFLRRGRRRVDARQHLRGALAAFQDLGAGPWVERAGQELRASGETAR
jgi:tetratricopeptide (TPR) repeat protein